MLVLTYAFFSEALGLLFATFLFLRAALLLGDALALSLFSFKLALQFFLRLPFLFGDT